MKKRVIIGAGFSGISALRRLSAYQKRFELEITLINEKSTSDFLPMLPDCLGRGIDPRNLSLDVKSLCCKFNCNFIQDKVALLDLSRREILTSSLAVNYDFLLIASGAETNFYANERVEAGAYKLDNARDAARILQAIKEKDFSGYIIAGGGYTGVEAAANLYKFFAKSKQIKKIVIVERAPAILGPLPQWMKDYAADNLRQMGVEVICNSGIADVNEESVTLVDGKRFDKAMLIWAAGVRAADFIQKLSLEKNPQGRIKADEYLRVNENCFVAGDAALVGNNSGFLRMAVQFAVVQGDCAAQNILRSINGARLRRYKPLDLGYVIPMANNRSCGQIFGINLKGMLPTVLHYLMCIYRLPGMGHKFAVARELLGK